MGSNATGLGRRRTRARTSGIALVIALATMFSSIAITSPPAQAASAPVARADVARTNAATQVAVSTCYGNDFDPDGDSFSVVDVTNPAHGTAFNGSTTIYYTPTIGFSGVETMTYTIEDSTGLTATGTVTVWVDTGTDSTQFPDLLTDYFYAYQGASVGFSTAQLLANDSDPQNQTITVVAVSEPSNNGTLTGTTTTGYTYTPGLDVALIGTDSQLNYLVTDTDGHVTQGAITIRILAANDTNTPPVARDDVARTNAATQVACLRLRQRLRSRRRQLQRRRRHQPRPRHRLQRLQLHLLHPHRRLHRRRNHHLHPPRRPRPHLHRHGDGVGRHRHRQHPVPRPVDRLLLRLPRRLGRLQHRATPRQRLRPPEPNHHRRRRLRTLQQRHPHRHHHHRLHLHPRPRRRPHRHRQPTQLPRHRHRRPRHPRRHHHPHPRRQRHQHTARRP